jgi:hypothetical protein
MEREAAGGADESILSIVRRGPALPLEGLQFHFIITEKFKHNYMIYFFLKWRPLCSRCKLLDICNQFLHA